MEQRISIERMEQAVNIFGSFDENIRLLEKEFNVTVTNRDGELRISGEAEDVMHGRQGGAGHADPVLPGGGTGGAERPLYHRHGPHRQRGADQRAGGGCAVHLRQGPPGEAENAWARRNISRRC